MMLVAALLLLVLFFVPLWRITLEAPQYPNGITMYIWINQITGDTEYTLQNINILNHYVGMKYIEPDTIPELKYFPIVVGIMVFLGLLAAWAPSKVRLGWVVLMLLLGALGVYDFYLWEYDYGHNLSPTAPIKVPGMAYQPPLIGSKMLLNFKAISYPHWGGAAMFASLILGFASFWTGRQASISSFFRRNSVSTAAAGALLLLWSCSKEPQPISYGNDGCHYCKMTAVDARFGAEWVSVKGKNYKFDAVECLLGYLQNTDTSHTYSVWVTPFDNPNKLIEPSNCTFLISKELPSPMGMNLTAFETQNSAQTHQRKYGGELYNWDQLQMRFTELDENI